MRTVSKRVFFLVAGISALSLSLARGAEEAPKEGKEGGEKRKAEARRGGDERRRNFDRRGGRDRRAGGQRNASAAAMRLMNVRDAGYLALAQVHARKQAPEKAIAVLKELLKESEDKNAQGFAHLALATIYKQQKKEAEAEAELKKVEGLAVIRAIEMLLQGVEDRVAKLEELLKEAKEPLAKATIIRRLIREYARAQDVEKLADLVERAKKLLTAKEAAAALEDELKLAMAGGNGGGGRGGMPDRAQMAQRAQQMRTEMQNRIKELEAAGKKEEAAKLKERLERIERMMKRFGGGRGGRRGRDGGREGRGDRKGGGEKPKANEAVDEF